MTMSWGIGLRSFADSFNGHELIRVSAGKRSETNSMHNLQRHNDESEASFKLHTELKRKGGRGEGNGKLETERSSC